MSVSQHDTVQYSACSADEQTAGNREKTYYNTQQTQILVLSLSGSVKAGACTKN